jgi:hypothetical protein
MRSDMAPRQHDVLRLAESFDHAGDRRRLTLRSRGQRQPGRSVSTGDAFPVKVSLALARTEPGVYDWPARILLMCAAHQLCR